MERIQHIRAVLRSSAFSDVARWSQCVYGRIGLICLLSVVSSLMSLGITLATKGLIDGAVASRADALWRYGIILAALIMVERGIAVVISLLRTDSSSELQKHMQSMLISSLLSKDYSSLKGYHSGELVNRFFSDVSVVKNGVVSILPSFVRIIVSFVGATAILIAMDWRFVPVLILAGLAGLAIVMMFREPMKRRHKSMQEAEGALHASAQETLENVRLIKASVSEDRVQRQIEARQEGLRQEQVRQGRFSTVMNNSMSLMFDISWLFCMI